MTWIKGHHAYKAGGEIVRQLATQVAPFNGRGYHRVQQHHGGAGLQQDGDCRSGELHRRLRWFQRRSGQQALRFGPLPPEPVHVVAVRAGHVQGHPGPDAGVRVRYENFGQPANNFETPPSSATARTIISRPTRSTMTTTTSVPAWASPTTRTPTPAVERQDSHPRWLPGQYDNFYNNMLSNMVGASPNAQANLAMASTTSTATHRAERSESLAQLPARHQRLNPYTTQTSVFSKNIRNPYYHHISFGVQEQLPGNMVLDIAYVGSLGRQLFFTNPINPGVPGIGGCGDTEHRLSGPRPFASSPIAA